MQIKIHPYRNTPLLSAQIPPHTTTSTCKYNYVQICPNRNTSPLSSQIYLHTSTCKYKYIKIEIHPSYLAKYLHICSSWINFHCTKLTFLTGNRRKNQIWSRMPDFRSTCFVCIWDFFCRRIFELLRYVAKFLCELIYSCADSKPRGELD